MFTLLVLTVILCITLLPTVVPSSDVCSFSWSFGTTVLGSRASGTFGLDTESCSLSVQGTPPQLAGQNILQCGWPMTAVTANVTFYGTSNPGTYVLTQAEFGDAFVYDIACNLNTGYPFGLDNAGVHVKFSHPTHQPGVFQETNFRIHTNQQYVHSAGGNQSAPYYETFNAYYDDLTNTHGNLTLCCSNFQTADGCYSPQTPNVIVSLSKVHPVPSCQSPAPSIHGDPMFIGLRGQEYQVHGIDGHVYNIISEPSLQMNSRFVFRTEGKCPVVQGQLLDNCFTHPGTYFGTITIMTREGRRVMIRAGSADNGFDEVSVDGEEVDELDIVYGMRGDRVVELVRRVSSHELVFQYGLYEIVVENSDWFLNVKSVWIADMRMLERVIRPHGLLGQTWKRGDWKLVGKVEDYAVEGDEFGCEFLYNQFVC